MINPQTSVLAKVILASAGLAVLIKGLGHSITLTPDPAIALSLVLIPPLILLGALVSRA